MTRLRDAPARSERITQCMHSVSKVVRFPTHHLDNLRAVRMEYEANEFVNSLLTPRGQHPIQLSRHCLDAKQGVISACNVSHLYTASMRGLD